MCRPRYKRDFMEMSVMEEEGQYLAKLTFRLPATKAIVQEVRGKTHWELIEKLSKLPSRYTLNRRQLSWSELVTAGENFKRLAESLEDLVRPGATDDEWIGIVINLSVYAPFKPHGPKKKRIARRKGRLARLLSIGRKKP